MNFRFVICLVAAIGSIAFRAQGDVAPVSPDVPITDAAKQSPVQTAYAAEVTQKVTAEVQKLVDDASDPATVNMVRQWLITEDPATAVAPYQTGYTAALNQAFLGLLAQAKTPLPAKINMGIIVWSLSGPKDNLAPTVIQLLGDKSPAVVLWAARAAGRVLPVALQNANSAFNNVGAGGLRDAMLDAIVSAVLNHPDGPLAWDIADSGYSAINPRRWTVTLVPAPANLGALVAKNLKLQKARIDYYQNTGVPANPSADTLPSYLFMSNVAWGSMNNADQFSAVQYAVDLTALFEQRLGTEAMDQNQELIHALVEEGTWIGVLGQILQDSGVQAAATAFSTLRPDTPQANIKAACDGALQALQGNPAFGNLAPGPTIGGPKSASNADGSTPTSLAHP